MTTFTIRPATAGDAAELARLLTALGYPVTTELAAARFATFSDAGEEAIAAADADGTRLLGLATLHATPVLHRAGPVGRVTALVVDPDARGRGIGRALMAAAEAWAAGRGCVLMEVTSNRRRTDAHAFYERLGYAGTSIRFGKEFSARG